MKKTALIFGSVIGIPLSGGMIYMVDFLFYKNPDVKGNDFLGYIVLVVLLSPIFFGIRSYRNNQLGGAISFKKALGTGVLISLIASTIYLVVWLFAYYLFFYPDFIDKYTAYALRHCAPSDVEAKAQSLREFAQMYKNPLFVMLSTFMEIFPLGVIISLISAFLLKRKQGAPDVQGAGPTR